MVAAIVGGIVYLLVRRRRGGAARPSEPAAPNASESIAARRALALGVVQGPAELLPVSSSAHIVLLPWLAGWDWDAVDPELRKSFEVALHAGAAAALLIGQRRLIAEELRAFDAPPRRSSSPSPSCPRRSVGYALERPIERRLGGPRATADRPARRRGGDAASPTAARSGAAAARPAPADGLALGVAQAAALAPGRLAQRRHPGRGPLAALLPRPGEPALAHDRAADHRRRHRAQGRAPRAAAAPRRSCAARWRSASPPPSPRPSPRSG